MDIEFDYLARKYVGPVATRYESKRVLADRKKWQAENDAALHLVRRIPEGAKTLDVPVGTGRLIPLLHGRKFEAYGLDVSPDMLALAQQKATETGTDIELLSGDIRDLPFPDNTFGLVSCLRFLNWIDGDGLQQVIPELARVAKDKLMLGIRYMRPVKEVSVKESGFRWAAMRLLNMGQLRASRRGLVIHDRSFLDRLFHAANLDIVRVQQVERRWDGTDYALFLLQKR